MDKYINQSITARREAFAANFEIDAAVHQKAYDAVRDIPGLGDAIDIAEKASYAAHLGKLFKKKKKE